MHESLRTACMHAYCYVMDYVCESFEPRLALARGRFGGSQASSARCAVVEPSVHIGALICVGGEPMQWKAGPETLTIAYLAIDMRGCMAMLDCDNYLLIYHNALITARDSLIDS